MKREGANDEDLMETLQSFQQRRKKKKRKNDDERTKAIMMMMMMLDENVQSGDQIRLL